MNVLTWETICKRMQNTLPPEILSKLETNFTLVEIKGKKVTIGYYDNEIYEDIIRYYDDEIFYAVSSTIDKSANIKYTHVSEPKIVEPEPVKPAPAAKASAEPAEEPAKEKVEKEKYSPTLKLFNTVHKYSWKFILCAFLCVLLCFVVLASALNFFQNLNFKETFYSMGSTKLYDNLRIIQISDLHNASYGKDNDKLVERISQLDPDIIVMTGDCIDSRGSADEVVALCARLVEIAPTYYIYGNNEVELAFDGGLTLSELDERYGFDDDNRDPERLYASDTWLKEKIESSGAKVLLNESDTIQIGKSSVEVFGVLTSNSSSFWPYAGSAYEQYIYDSADFKILLSHEPFIFEDYEGEVWGNVAFCGHTHGGVMRLPFIGGVYSHEDGFFPELRDCYVYGKYKLDNSQLIVSGGLANGEIFRFNNQPELVIVDVSQY